MPLAPAECGEQPAGGAWRPNRQKAGCSPHSQQKLMLPWGEVPRVRRRGRREAGAERLPGGRAKSFA
jgi:hypothetical protein